MQNNNNNLKKDKDTSENEVIEEFISDLLEPNNKTQKKATQSMASYGKYSGLAFQMIAALLLGAFGGIYADKYLHTTPFFTVTLLLLSLATAMYLVIKTLKNNN